MRASSCRWPGRRRRAALGRQRHKRRQVLVLGSQPVHDPRSERGQALDQAARLVLEDRRFVIRMRRVHRPYHGQLVSHGSQVGHQFRDLQARFALLTEPPRAAEQFPGLLGSGQVGCHLVEIPLAVQLIELRLRVQQVHLAGATLHEQLDDSLGPGTTRRFLGRHVVDTQSLRSRFLGQ